MTDFEEIFQAIFKMANTPAGQHESNYEWAYTLYRAAREIYPKAQAYRAALAERQGNPEPITDWAIRTLEDIKTHYGRNLPLGDGWRDLVQVIGGLKSLQEKLINIDAENKMVIAHLREALAAFEEQRKLNLSRSMTEFDNRRNESC